MLKVETLKAVPTPARPALRLSQRAVSRRPLPCRATRQPAPDTSRRLLSRGPDEALASNIVPSPRGLQLSWSAGSRIDRRALLMERPVPVPPRPGDLLDADLSYRRWAAAGPWAKLMLDGLVGNLINKSGGWWASEPELRQREILLDRAQDLRNPNVVYARYFRQGFHGHNSNFAIESVARQASAMTFIPAIMPNLSLRDLVRPSAEFLEKVRQGPLMRDWRLTQAVATYKQRQGPRADKSRVVVDMGCGTGASTRLLARHYRNATVVGIDMSAPMLAEAALIGNPPPGAFTEAQLRQLWLGDDAKSIAKLSGRIIWQHDNAEGTCLRANCADLVTAHFVAHELPTTAMAGVAREAMRVLRPGGWFAIVENFQNFKGLHEDPAWPQWAATVLPAEAPLARRLRRLAGDVYRRAAGASANEPHAHEYFAEDLPAIFRAAGLVNVEDTGGVQGCTLVMGQKPPR